MPAMRVLLTIAWLAAVVYSTVPTLWLIVHTRARRLGSLSRTPLVILAAVWFALWFLVVAITLPWHRVRLYSSGLAWLFGGLLIAAGMITYVLARQNFSTDQVLGRAELQPEKHVQRLVVSGIRSRVRHPYYLGHLCEMLGWTIGSGLVVLYPLLVFTVITGTWMIREEERELVSRFGEPYVDYRRRVPALLPRWKS
jgi:protein-S-isoprenylcysteine O-methyltransferase Ste14